MTHTYPPFGNWQDFERFCRDFFERFWDVQSIQIVGRSGQGQDGVDVLAMLPGMTWRGIQCKVKTGGQLTRGEMKAELDATAGLSVTLEHYVFATTAARDAKVQRWARELGETVDFGVSIFAWNDFCDALSDPGYRPLLAKYFPSFALAEPAPDPTNPAEALHAFRSQHWSELLPLPSLAQARGQRHADLLLTDIYTALDVEATVRVTTSETEGDKPSGPADRGDSMTLPGDAAYLEALISHERSRLEAEHSEYTPDHLERRCRALEAAAANRRLVLVGAPGSGKSTFGRFLTVCLLGESLGRGEANLATLVGGGASQADEPGNGFVPWPHGAPLTFFVSLQKFQTSEHFPATGADGGAGHLFAFLESSGPKGAFFDRGLRQALRQDDGVLVILDGLDETPSAEAGREQLRQVICGFARAYPGCRLLVTSRPYAYASNSPWRLDAADFASVELAPFDEAQQRAFVGAWYRRLVARQLLDVSEQRQQQMAGDLVAQIERIAYLGPLAQSPLMLTMMADLHASNGGRLPTGGRAALYAGSVELLLDRWNETRDSDTKPTEALGMPLELIQVALQQLAFTVHRSRGAGEGETPEIWRAELWEALVGTREAHGIDGRADDRGIMNYLHQRSGILLGESESIYRFPHRSYQEYLAAAHLAANEFPELLDQVVSEDPELWREVVQLVVGQVKPFMAWTVVERLVPSGPPDDPSLDDPRFFRALLAGLAIREQKLTVNLARANAAKLDNVRDWLRRVVELGALEVPDRVQAGQILGLLGDDRAGVGLGPKGLPDIEWVEIPTGSFTMGSERYDREKPVHQEHVEGFRISRYPLTHAQYQPFIDDGGYTERWRSCWTKAGWDWKGDRAASDAYGHPFDLPNHPRVGVSWYEAVAYCNWLSETTGGVYRLPSEAEWERSARGVDGREYPWGATFNATLCNSMDGGPGTTTAVGLYPGGESPAGANGVGVRDASGNVWEWCSTKWRESYEEAAKDDLEGNSVRVLRGGGFADGSLSARCAYRVRFGPDDIFSIVGFRLVAPI